MDAKPLQVSREDFDCLPFGIIRIDREGTIQQYNEFESKLSGRKKVNVIGKNFFRDIAPCTDVAEFAGRFREAQKSPPMNLQFPFTFAFDEPRRVFIHIVNGPEETYWIFVSEAETDRALSSMLLRR